MCFVRENQILTCLDLAGLRARAKITSRFRIPSSGHLGRIFIRTMYQRRSGDPCGCVLCERPYLPQSGRDQRLDQPAV